MVGITEQTVYFVGEIGWYHAARMIKGMIATDESGKAEPHRENGMVFFNPAAQCFQLVFLQLKAVAVLQGLQVAKEGISKATELLEHS